MELSYYEYLKDTSDVYKARNRVLDLLRKNKGNIKKTAREMKMSKNTVKKIRKLYQEKGLVGLHDQRRGPNQPWKKIDQSWEKLIRREFNKGLIKTISNFRLFFNRKYDQRFSYKLYWRICSALLKKIKAKPGNYRQHKKKHKRKAYWREKYQGEVFKHWQTDPKYLDDIQMYYPQMIGLGLPPYQLGFRDVVSGSTFIFYSYALSANVLSNAVSRFLSHLKKWKIPTTNLQLQSDNDSAMIGSPKAKRRSLFSQITEDIFQAEHLRIPKGACWKQGYIESYNWTCELEFYSVERFKSLKDFLSKAFTYQLIYNLLRPQTGLGEQTPYQVAKLTFPNLKSTFYTDLPPIIYQGDEPAPRIVNLENRSIIEKEKTKLQKGHLFWEKTRNGKVVGAK